MRKINHSHLKKSDFRKKHAIFWLIMILALAGFFSLLRTNISAVAAQEIASLTPTQQPAQETPTPPEDTETAATAFPTPSQTPDKYFADYFAHSWDIPEEVAQGNTFWIEVNLNAQTLSAYRGNQIINTFLISSGTDSFKTVTGTYRIYAKYSQYTMRGPDYDLPDVPYTMFFYKGYSIHGTYWHHNFGAQMSRGCVNMKTEDAAWVFENAPVGTYVFIHY
jgi:lipoprotein-anchoring transpeptidase ErfK/SrfK